MSAICFTVENLCIFPTISDLSLHNIKWWVFVIHFVQSRKWIFT
jgi:hypothetical protein